MKYIDAEKLKKIVEQAKQRALKGIEVDEDLYCDGRADAFGEVLLEINYLQQEQPLLEVKETIVETGGIKGNLEEIPSNVDLEKEIEGTTGDYAEGRRLEQRILEESRRFPEVSFAKLSRIAKHFYDFGKQAGAKWMAEHKESNYE